MRLHPENETRLLSLTVSDTPEQTAAIFQALANSGTHGPNLSQWQALQTWLAMSNCQVDIPYADHLAKSVPPVAVRLRRDFKTVLTLIRAHALLHQARRQKDADGHIVAEVADYVAAKELVAELLAEGAEVAIKPEIRETVRTVEALLAQGRDEVKQTEIKKELKLDKSVVSRRVAAALDAGVLRNLEDRRGKRARLVLGDPLPEEIELLPKPEQLHGCTVVERGKSASPDPWNGSNCAYCGMGALAGDPLLDASTDGDVFVTHRTCFDREWRARSIAPAQLTPLPRAKTGL